MTVQELIKKLSKVAEKSIPVVVSSVSVRRKNEAQSRQSVKINRTYCRETLAGPVGAKGKRE